MAAVHRSSADPSKHLTREFTALGPNPRDVLRVLPDWWEDAVTLPPVCLR